VSAGLDPKFEAQLTAARMLGGGSSLRETADAIKVDPSILSEWITGNDAGWSKAMKMVALDYVQPDAFEEFNAAIRRAAR
jgi:hypothetical protein